MEWFVARATGDDALAAAIEATRVRMRDGGALADELACGLARHGGPNGPCGPDRPGATRGPLCAVACAACAAYDAARGLVEWAPERLMRLVRRALLG
jgi:hypothetical protein